MSDVSESLRSLTKNERYEQIAQLLTKNEQITQVAHQNWMKQRIAHFLERIAISLIFSQKMSDSLRKPMSEFPTLVEF